MKQNVSPVFFRLNRTFMELKHNYVSDRDLLGSLNRTFMELKHGKNLGVKAEGVS